MGSIKAGNGGKHTFNNQLFIEVVSTASHFKSVLWPTTTTEKSHHSFQSNSMDNTPTTATLVKLRSSWSAIGSCFPISVGPDKAVNTSIALLLISAVYFCYLIHLVNVQAVKPQNQSQKISLIKCTFKEMILCVSTVTS